jgi:hypothetical protein
LRDFEKRYKPAVADRHHELEELRETIRRAWGEIRKARSGDLVDASQAEPPAEAPQQPFRPKRELQRLFRELARRIHPDLADDYDERRRRHEFMAEATRAYRLQDAVRLQWLLEHWEASPAAAPGLDADSRLARANQRIAWLRYRITELHQSIAALHASPLADLLRQAQQARRHGRNMIAELRNQVVQELDQARQDLQRVEAALADLDGDAVRIIRANAGL